MSIEEILSRYLEEGGEALPTEDRAKAIQEFRSLVKSPAWGALAKAGIRQGGGAHSGLVISVGMDRGEDPIRRILLDEYRRGYADAVINFAKLPEKWIEDLENYHENAE